MLYVSLFLAEYYTGPMHRILVNDISGHHMLQNSKRFTPMMIWCIHQTQASLAYQIPVSFSKEHVIY